MTRQDRHAKRMAKKTRQPKVKRKPRPDFSQRALAGVEKIIGGKLADGMKRPRP
jgi:hypothetical protein